VEPSSAPWRVLEPSESPADVPRAQTQRIAWPVVAAAVTAVAVAIGAFVLAARSDPQVGVDGAIGVLAGSGDPWMPSANPGRGSGAELVVEVGGAVVRPGVYHLPAGSRIGDAIAAAGGYGPRVDAAAADARLNLAAIVRDGDEVHVPGRDEVPARPVASGGGTDGAGSGGTGDAGRLIDLNRATAAQLDTLPGVGPATAAKIIAAREQQPFASVDDLRTRKVLGAATLERIRDLVTVEP